MIRWVQI